MKRFLQVFRDSSKPCQYYLQTPLKDGEQGNIQALEWMAKIVNEDRCQPDLRNYVLREIVKDAAGHDSAAEIKRIFEFCQKKIVYRADPVGIERVADLWATIYALNPHEPEGDCGIKSTCLATCLALLGYRTCFVVIRDNDSVNSYNHVYVGLMNDDGTITGLDPTPENVPVGWEAESKAKAIYKIFDE